MTELKDSISLICPIDSTDCICDSYPKSRENELLCVSLITSSPAGAASVSYELQTEWRFRAGAADGYARPVLLGVAPDSRQANPGNSRSGLRALERDEDIPRPTLCLERGGPALVQVRCVVTDRQRVAVQGIDPFPRLPL
jgi:hypothetical protein